jgi:hypothetical protein
MQITNFNTQGIQEYLRISDIYSLKAFGYIVQRQCEYLTTNPYCRLSERMAPFAWMAAGGLVGFKVATQAANQFQLEKEKPVLQGAGTVIGGGVGVYLYTQLKEKDLFFQAWADLQLEQISEPHIAEKCKNDPFLTQFVGSIQETMIKVPVRLRSGHLIDLSTFKAMHPDRDGHFLCPYTREPLDLGNPTIDLELYALILKRTQYLLREEAAQLEPNSVEYRYGVRLAEVVDAKLASVYTKHLEGINQLQASQAITEQEARILQSQFYTYFGVDPTGKADPEHHVEAHEMDFSLDWKQIISDHSKILFKGTPPTQFMPSV